MLLTIGNSSQFSSDCMDSTYNRLSFFLFRLFNCTGTVKQLLMRHIFCAKSSSSGRGLEEQLSSFLVLIGYVFSKLIFKISYLVIFNENNSSLLMEILLRPSMDPALLTKFLLRVLPGTGLGYKGVP